jgi:hypothetical protein
MLNVNLVLACSGLFAGLSLAWIAAGLPIAAIPGSAVALVFGGIFVGMHHPGKTASARWGDESTP